MMKARPVDPFAGPRYTKRRRPRPVVDAPVPPPDVPVEALAAAEALAASSPLVPPPITAKVKDLVAWVGDDPARAELIMHREVEEADKPRVTLLEAMTEIIASRA